jgi:hypothetical protein
MEELQNDIITNDKKVEKFYSVDPEWKDELTFNEFEELNI